MANIVIIGNGAAGNSAAETIRRAQPDASIKIITRETVPEYSACALPDYLSGWVERERLFIKQWHDYQSNDIEVLGGRDVIRINTAGNRLLTNQEDIVYDRLILATGSRAFIPPVPGRELQGNFVVKTVDDIDAIMAHRPQQAVVAGAGNIGVEMAQALHSRGCKVFLVEMMQQIFPRIFDREAADRISAILAAHGIEVLTGQRLVAVSGRGRLEEARAGERVLACDTVIWAAGMRQNVEIARDAGIDIGALGGIKVDSYLQTNCQDIYACGDCIESTDMLTGRRTLSMLWPNAKRQGQIAGLNCLGRQVVYEGAVNLVVEEIFGVPVASMGLTAQALEGQPLEVVEGQGQSSYWRLLVVGDRIMGMQAIGVTDGLGAVMALMKNRIRISDFEKIVSDPALAHKASWYLPASRFIIPAQSLGMR